MPSQRDGPHPAGRAAQQPACARRRSASANRRTPAGCRSAPQRPRSSLKIVTKRSAQERILPNAGPLFQSGKENPEHRNFSRTAVYPRRAQRCRSLAAKQAAKATRKRLIQNPSTSSQRDGPRPARTGGAATRMRPSPQRQRQPPRPGNPPKRHHKTRAASRGTAANYIAQAAPAGRWPALCESGKENCKHRKFRFLQTCSLAASAAPPQFALTPPHTPPQRPRSLSRNCRKSHCPSRAHRALARSFRAGRKIWETAVSHLS